MNINGKTRIRAKEVCTALEYGKTTKTDDVLKYISSLKNYTQKCQVAELVLNQTLLIVQKTRKSTTVTSMRGVCVSSYFRVNNQQ